MSFAGTTTTSPIGRHARRGRVDSAGADWREAPRDEYRGGSRMARLGLIAVGVAVGALLGAGVALLVAPARGATTRRRLGRSARRATSRLGDAWLDLGGELRGAGSRTRRKLRLG